MKKQIILISSEFPPFRGGISSYAYNLAKVFLEEGYDVKVFAQNRLPEQREVLFPTFPNFEIKYFLYFSSSLLNKIYQLTLHLFHLASFLKTYPKAKVIIVDPSNLFQMSLLSKLYKVSYDVILHGSEMIRYTKKPLSKRVFCQALKESDHIWCNSNFTDREYKKQITPAKSTVVFCGVKEEFITKIKKGDKVSHLKKKYSFQKNDFILGTIARLDPRKGQDQVIEAIQSLRQKIPSLKYLICGTGNYEEALKEKVKLYKLEDRVVFTGSLLEEDLIDHYDLIDLYVMPNRIENSTVEGFGISFIEAAARGIPSIGVKNGGVEDAILHGKTGFLLNSTELSELESEILRSYQKRSEWKTDEIRNFAAQFQWATIAKQILGE